MGWGGGGVCCVGGWTRLGPAGAVRLVVQTPPLGGGVWAGGAAGRTQRNKCAVGDTLELVTKAAPPVTFTAQDLRDADGLPLESGPHPMQRFTRPLPCRAAPLSLVRRKLPAETVDIRPECGKI